MKRNNILAKKRLMKTTTYITALLVAVTMILSSAATVATVNENENVSIGGSAPTAPASFGGNADTNLGPDDPEICILLDKPIECRGSKGIVVWDNGMTFTGVLAAQEDTTLPLDAHPADDFYFAVDTTVGDVHWGGGYYYGAAGSMDWAIEFCEDDGTGNFPGANFAGPFTYTWAEITKVPYGSYFELSVDLPQNVVFNGGEKYWIKIWADGDYPPQSGWGFYPPSTLNDFVFKSVYFGFPNWVTASTMGYSGWDMCFQLTAKPDHDVYVSEIIAPTDDSEFCPCTPVEVTVTNAGLYDEEVPVSVEIRRYILQDSFEDPFGIFWDPIYGGNMWMQSMFETAFPWVVIPRTGGFMAELDSGLTGPGTAWLDSMPIDLTGLCHPMMSFYMWHDDYGSDDYIDVQVNFVDVAGPYERLCCPDCPVGWQEHVIDLSAYAGQVIWISFEGNCDQNPGAYNLQIDDVSVYDQEYYEEMDVDVSAGETVNVEFPEWCPCNWQILANTFFDVEVVASTHLETDQAPSNDEEREVVTVYLPFMHDVAAISIDKPVDNVVPVQTFEMAGTIKNVGQYQECCFSVYMSVHELGAPVQLLFENFDDLYPPLFNWPPVSACGAWSLAGIVDGNWGPYFGAFTGAPSGYPEAQYYWIPYGYIDDEMLYTCAIDTTGYASIEISWYQYLSHYSGPYTLSVETSSDGVNWDPVWEAVNPTSLPTGQETVQTGQNVGGTIYVGWRFHGGDPYNLNYWNIDDVEISGVPIGPAEYEDEFCIDDIEVCEELQLEFDDWTPATPWPDCGERTYAIVLETRLCDPMDDNPLNDKTSEVITVEFWHDVAINEITSPAAKVGILIFDNGDTDGSNGLSVLGSPKRTIMDDFTIIEDVNINEMQLFLVWNTLPPGSGVGWEVQFRADASGTPGAVIATPSELTYTETATGRVWFGRNEAEIISTFSDVSLSAGTYWVEGWGTAAQPENMFWMAQSPPNILGAECWVDYTDLGGLMSSTTQFGVPYGVNFKLLGTTGGPPPVDIWVTCGEQDFCATFENLGTFDEPGCIIDWTLYEYITDPENPTYLTGGSDTIDLDAGEVLEDYCFGSYDFVDPGIYELVVEIIAPTIDCYPDNNEMDLGIGVDCEGPHSGHNLDPAFPDGENNWYISTVEVTLDAADTGDPASGIDEIKYIHNGVSGTFSGDTGTFDLVEDGIHHVEFWSIDNAGNEEEEHGEFEVAIDTGDPSVDLIYEAYEEDDGWHVDFTALASDSTSGMDKVEFYIDGSLELTDTESPYNWTIKWQDDYEDVTFKATAYDNAGNSASDTIDGDIIESTPVSHSQSSSQSVPVWVVRQTNPLVI